MTKTYFPNLNGLRFIAALMVILHHIEQCRYIFGLPNYFSVGFFNIIGKLGVILFFVLSGFLITFLLLQERSLSRSISIRKFYLRRILRIWPLYYVIVLLGLFALPHFHRLDLPVWTNSIQNLFWLKSLMYLLLLPNLAMSLFPPFPFVVQTWSVGVEEQFYLIWPLLLKRFKNVYVILFAVIITYLSIEGILVKILQWHPADRNIGGIALFWSLFNIDCMAIGGLAAAVLFIKPPSVLSFFFNRWVQLAVYGTTAVLLVRGIHFQYFNYEIYSVLFAVIIMNLAGNKKCLFTLENPVLVYLGKISYGLYMFHPMLIVLTLKSLMDYGFINFYLVDTTCLALVIIVASISYRIWELPFLRKKVQYSLIVTGDSVALPAT